jgi:hypothetical protein
MLPTLLLITALSAPELELGLYHVVPTDSAPIKATAPDGSTIGLTILATKNIGKVLIRSETNDNSRFSIIIQDAGPLGGGRPKPVALVAGDWAVPMRDSSEDETTHKFVFVSTSHIDGKTADRVAAALGIKPLRREHPGYKARVTFRALAPSYKLGTAPILELAVENVGDVPICFVEGGRQRGPRDNQFAFVAMSLFGQGKAVPDTGSPINFGGIGAFRTIEPGKTWTKQVPLDGWFRFTEADTYEITGIYRVQLLSTDEVRGANARERPRWDDFFTGECRVKITKE